VSARHANEFALTFAKRDVSADAALLFAKYRLAAASLMIVTSGALLTSRSSNPRSGHELNAKDFVVARSVQMFRSSMIRSPDGGV
jgi:hypothetical protein